jgi:integrase
VPVRAAQAGGSRLTWQDVDLAGCTLKIVRVRNVVDGKVIEKLRTKSLRSTRTLPLDDRLVAALKAMRKTQAAEKPAAGVAYTDSGYVVTDELGVPVNPEWFTDEFPRLAKCAGVPRKTPHGGRHTSNSLMEKLGVPDSIRAAWHGHAIEVNRRTYTHALPEDLMTGLDALSHGYGG